jgi:hypothetical protein
MSDLKYHRTMKSAFGPYTSDHIEEDPDPAEAWMFWVAIGVTVVLLIVIAALLIL